MQPDLYHQAVADLMYEELDCSRLTVSLAACWGWMGDDGRQRRVVEERNPGWYEEFCRQYPSNRTRPRRKRHGDTLIKRGHTLRALAEISSGHVRTEYARRLWPVVQQRAADIQAEHRRRHPEWYAWLEMEIANERRLFARADYLHIYAGDAASGAKSGAPGGDYRAKEASN